MRFGKKYIDYKDVKNKKMFAWLPIRLNGEVRWLENVNIKGYYYVGSLTNKLRFMKCKFIDYNE